MHLVFDAGEILIKHIVHDTADGVRAIGGRGAARHHIHARDQQFRQIVDIDTAGGSRERDAMTVKQGQGARDAQVAQIDVVQPDR